MRYYINTNGFIEVFHSIPSLNGKKNKNIPS